MSKKRSDKRRSQFWKSLTEKKTGRSDWEKPEFPASRNDMQEAAQKSGVDRKSFLKFMGAGALAATAACRRPTEQIVPAVIQPAEYVPGVATHYATTAPDGTGLIVRTREGRPVKIAGNPSHPITQGGASASVVASIMDLYDPDRTRRPYRINRKGGKTRATEGEIVSELQSKLEQGRYMLMTGAIDSPSTRGIINAFLGRFGKGRHVEYRNDPALNQIAAAQEDCYGRALVPNYRFDRAEMIVAIDGDFLGTLLQPSYFAADFGKKREVLTKNKLNRLVAFESTYSVTGSRADRRYAIRPGDQAMVALSIAAYIALDLGANAPGNAAALLRQYHPTRVSSTLGHERGLYREGHYERVIGRVARELFAARGKSLVLGGSPLAGTGNAREAQIAINLLNSMLGNDGITVDYQSPLGLTPGASYRELSSAVKELESGAVDVLIVSGVNPVYDLPKDTRVAEALGKVKYIVSLNDRIDETTRLADAILPGSHYLETWGDAELLPNIHSVRQPVVRPIHETRGLEDRLIQIAGGTLGGARTFHEFVKARWQGLARGPFQRFWTSVLQNGYHAPGASALRGTSPGRNFRGAALASVPASVQGDQVDANSLVLGMYLGLPVYDGAGANNAYRQELPDPVTKIVWDNYLAILPATARSMGLEQGDVARVKLGDRNIEIPVHLQPGLHPQSAVVALGYGRSAAGKVGNGVGVKVIDLAVAGSDSLRYSGSIVQIEATGRTHDLASTQTIYRNDDNQRGDLPGEDFDSRYRGSSNYDRPILRETHAQELSKPNPSIKPDAVPYPEDGVIIPEWTFADNRWHMVVDLNQCTGCGACVTSCNLENNIPMVGRDQVLVGREMHWLRMDRYFADVQGDDAEEELDVRAAHQPMLCQHCENAPCENVCPVAATTHSSEGLNLMTYNRCIGTRYCANNCPYKVRRFNWYENWNHMEGFSRPLRDPMHLGLNPDVTVRARGVMEKCTFCIQRISTARQESRARGEKFIPDGKVVTACQEVCPTNAISFGNISDPSSQVAKLAKDRRAYQVLDFLGVKPSVTYLANVRNEGEEA